MSISLEEVYLNGNKERVFEFFELDSTGDSQSRIVRIHALSNGQSIFGDVICIIPLPSNSEGVTWVDIAYTKKQLFLCRFASIA
jgi:hypothetical protein